MDVPLPGSMIFIDHFAIARGAYILSHFHSDHLRGLHVGWRYGFIHCSKVTARFLWARFGVTLPVRPHVLEEPFSVEDPTHAGRQVFATFIEANHCPGSVIVVVDGLPAGPIVNTGDFRYYDGLLDSPTLRRLISARDASDGQQCHKLCLDTTWAHPLFEQLPSKIESIQYVLDLIEDHPGERVFLHSHGSGDEEILEAVAGILEPDQKLSFAEKARLEELQLAQVPFVGRCELLGDSLSALGSDERFIVIAGAGARTRDRRLAGVHGIEISCSTLWWARCSYDWWQSMPVLERGVYHVLFAMHSSLAELRAFAQALAPSTVHALCPSPIARDRGGLAELLGLSLSTHDDHVFVVGDVPAHMRPSASTSSSSSTTVALAPLDMRLVESQLDTQQVELISLLDSQLQATTDAPSSSVSMAAPASSSVPTAAPTLPLMRRDSVASTDLDSDSEKAMLPICKRPRH